ncbi:hypothetical protein llap_5428 [Limosa lapponica baueri]|uniref:Uncharacterized protein n=1 Tax=Limosa lapponica baueri TaxID=1758121 RepID=A0A2I0UDY1_LIMLA|nr:hypothetical protein llap_5428 [Limosa lapponica baueri]
MSLTETHHLLQPPPPPNICSSREQQQQSLIPEMELNDTISSEEKQLQQKADIQQTEEQQIRAQPRSTLTANGVR